jgi:CubicO group peptidase (beta-lactamase class C family)
VTRAGLRDTAPGGCSGSKVAEWWLVGVAPARIWFDFRLLKEAMGHYERGGAIDGEMGLTPEELARLTPEELAELRSTPRDTLRDMSWGTPSGTSRACGTRWPIAGLTRIARCR